MKILSFFSIIFSCLILTSCEQKKKTPITEQKDILLENPIILISPKNETNYASTATTNEIIFKWTPHKTAKSYELVVRNLKSGRITTQKSQTNTATLTLKQNTNYEWFVTSIDNKNNQIASNRWTFFNSSKTIKKDTVISNLNRSPQKADAEFPEDKGTANYWNQYLELKWNGVDLDKDIVAYEVYFGKDQPSKTPIAKTTENKYFFGDLDIKFDTTYYWKIKTIDSKGNTSVSKTFSFVFFCSKC